MYVCGSASNANFILKSDRFQRSSTTVSEQLLKELSGNTILLRTSAVSSMGEYEDYSDQHYYYRYNDDARQKDRSAARKTHDAWDKVLYGIGSVYFKLVGK